MSDLVDKIVELVRQAYDAGFDASGEGWNGEYPGTHHQNRHYIERRRERLRAILADPSLPLHGEDE